MNEVIIQLENVYKAYKIGNDTILALKNINLLIKKTEFISIVGPSGSGKTTLLNLIGALDKPTKGKILFNGIDLTQQNDKEISKYRAENVGFIFQTFNLIPSLNVWENVKLPTYFSSKKGFKEDKIMELLELVGLKERAFHKPLQLSGGEQQRVAIARALVNDPQILIADEPTGNLDSKNAEIILDIFKNLNLSGKTIILATHNLKLVEYSNRIIHLYDGVIKDEFVR
jgi:putative ABC transport system ATP-binding protein